ncbi:MAG: DNA-directed RNA polymerase subunit alpha [Planctomycetota bacterium]|jgi:DNA-directed RNA polymerase subunit alpha
MESTQDHIEEEIASPVDVWSWTHTSPDALNLSEILEFRRTVLSNPTARRELTNKLSSTEEGSVDGVQAGIGWWICNEYRRSLDHLEKNHDGPVATFAYADSAWFAGHLGLEGVDPRPAVAAELIMNSNPSLPEERILVMRALIAADKADSAKSFLEKQDAAFRDSADGMFFEGHLAEIEGDYAAADAAYQKALELNENHALTLFRLARWHDLSCDDDLAIEYYTRLTTHKPPHINALINLGVLYEDHGKFPEAAHCYRRVLSIYPQHPRARLYLKDAESSFNMYYDEEQEVRQDRKNQILKIPVSDFELSVRSRNCLSKMNIVTLGDLVDKTEVELLSYKNFGETSLSEIKQILDMKGLRLGMRPDEDLVPLTGGGSASAAPTNQAAAPSFSVDPDDERLKKSVNELNLSVRARKCLSNLDIKLIGDLIAYTADDLLGQRNFGVTSLKEIIEQVEHMGLAMRTVDR